MSDTTSTRTYRFGPLDRTGLILGVTGRQAAMIGTGAVLSGWLLDRHAPAPVVLAPFVLATAVAFARIGGDTVADLLPAWGAFAGRAVLRRNRWLAPLPFVRVEQARPAIPVLPPFMAGLTLIDAGPVPWAPERLASVGAVTDRRTGTVSATVPVQPGGFCLLNRSEQERLIGGWGDVLGGFCRERSTVASVRWTETMAPVGLNGCRRFLAANGRGKPEPLDDYRQLLEDAEATSSGHQILVTVTVAERRVRGRGGQRGAAATDALLEEVRLLTARLHAAGIEAGLPLSPAELADIIRHGVDPHALGAPGDFPSVAAAAGVMTMTRPAPLATDAAWSHVRVDGSAHRSFWVAEWPRLDMPPNWMEPLLMQPGAVRTISLIYEPVPPVRSRRQVDREATKLASDEEQRARSGFRIGARHHRQQGALAEREAELVAGYAELCFAGFLTVSTPDPDELDRACGEYLQAAAQSGLELRPLHGRHDLGLLCTLPVGRGLAERRLA